MQGAGGESGLSGGRRMGRERDGGVSEELGQQEKTRHGKQGLGVSVCVCVIFKPPGGRGTLLNEVGV